LPHQEGLLCLTCSAMRKLEGMMLTKRSSRTNFFVDSIAGLAFVFTALSGKSYGAHLVAALIFAAFVVVHLILHWDWVVSCSRRIFAGSMARRGRVKLNYEIDIFILVMFVISTTTGLIMTMSGNTTVIAKIHGLSSWLFVLGSALHVALHRDWVVMMLKRSLRRPTGNVPSSWSVSARWRERGQRDSGQVAMTKANAGLEMQGEIV
jgi:hypothetical protein